MSTVIPEQTTPDPECLQRRIHALGRDALQGARPLSDLLGEALAELGSALAAVRELQAELERERARALRTPSADRCSDGFGNGHGAAVVTLSVPAHSADDPPRPGVDFFTRPVPDGPAALEASLRARIAGALYLGTLRAGDRLPSLRELSRRTGMNHKVVRRVYRALERGGVIEVRDRSGIYIADHPAAEAGEPAGMEAWTTGVLVEAVQRGLPAGDLPAHFTRVVDAAHLRCACVESTEDDRFALCREVGERFGLRTFPVRIAPGEAAPELGEADLVITTPFHAEQVRRALTPGQPLVVASRHPALLRAVEGCPADGTLRIVCVERAAGDRLRHGLGPALARRVRVVALDGSGATREECLRAPGVATLAAWDRLGGGDPPPELTLPPYLSPGAIRRIASLLVRRSDPSADGGG